jgi:hypothetical protein
VKRSGLRSSYRYSGPPPEVVEACLERGQYACEINGCDLRGNRGEGWSLQHRRPRGKGGSVHPRLNTPANLLVVCGSGTTGCHGLIENELRAAAYEVGWLNHWCTCDRSFDCEHSPRHTPVLILRGRWVLLDDIGHYEDVAAPAGAERWEEITG